MGNLQAFVKKVEIFPKYLAYLMVCMFYFNELCAQFTLIHGTYN